MAVRLAPIALGTAATVALAAAPAAASHLTMPESVLVHRGQTYVSQIGTVGANDGSIVRVNRAGNVTGTVVHGGGATTLVDPKGLAAMGNQICVTDVTAVRCFNRNTGAPGMTTRAERKPSIASTGRSTATPSGICSPSTSRSMTFSQPTMRATVSTTSPACSGCRNH